MYERHIFNLVLKNLKSWTVLLNNRMPRLLYTSNISLFIFCGVDPTICSWLREILEHTPNRMFALSSAPTVAILMFQKQQNQEALRT